MGLFGGQRRRRISVGFGVQMRQSYNLAKSYNLATIVGLISLDLLVMRRGVDDCGCGPAWFRAGDAMGGGGVGAGVGAEMVAWANAMCKVMEGMQAMKEC